MEGEKIIENPTESIIFSPDKSLSKARLRMKMKHDGLKRGRQRKFHETIILLTFYYEKGYWGVKLDKQMEDYYQEKYPEYFGRFAKTKGAANKRFSNAEKAKRTKKEADLRERRKTGTSVRSAVHHPRSEPIDIQIRRKRSAGS